ncbi:SSXT family protein [Klebsormidium nitens]|uniref:SSXT family protein n=1 Tax=Klebsormidium nitens TaxID=105231 RepID=A0A1Y1HWZ3_KLENI|nr:SSXT family protein [Klebsormidium nitens]|eukprot:GAQ81491.1 SSXT family protein [Klebsormidium nitens]
MQQPSGGPAQAPFPASSITTELIQKYLDENKQLILAILDNQSLGKLTECAHYQARLQQNLMFLAAIADAQPQAPQPAPPQPAAPPPQPSFNNFQSQPPQSSYPAPAPSFSQPQTQAPSQPALPAQSRPCTSAGDPLKESAPQEGNKPEESTPMEGVSRSEGGPAPG